ncbi:MAG: polymer-forming cytoskeletal protein [Spirochaetaceae bacterium]|nr:polymer-forming cytoskeletal protein [Spirochaetaceae bacterium]
MAFNGDDISINTFIGSGSAVSGDVKIAGFVTVHGDLDGDLEATGKVIVSEEGRVRGNITAKSAIIGGVVEGNVTAPDLIQLFETAAVIGDLSTKKLKLEDGVLFHGHCISLANEEEYQDARSKSLDRAAIASFASLLNSTTGDEDNGAD